MTVRGTNPVRAGEHPRDPSAAGMIAAAKARRRRLRGPVLVVVLAVVLLLLGGWFTVRDIALHTSPTAGNRALVDASATTAVIGDISDELGKIFSYSYQNTAVTEKAAKDSLTGAAYRQYQQLFAKVRAHAADQRLTLATTVVAAGVKTLSDNHATLLVFLDQKSSRADNGTSSAAAAQLAITAKHSHAHWLISDIRTR